MERRILRAGRELTAAERNAAGRAGVVRPERIRVLTVPGIPLPGFAWLHRIAAAFGFDGSQTAGMSLRYGIFIREDAADDFPLLLHECVHTGQYERFGSLAAFLRRYLNECLTAGYSASPLEQEARLQTARLLASL